MRESLLPTTSTNEGMIVKKFGGTSLENPERMRQVASIIDEPKRQLIVLSAIAGTTNALERINQAHIRAEREVTDTELNNLRQHYDRFVFDLLEGSYYQQGVEVIRSGFEVISRILKVGPTPIGARTILAQGELFSTRLFQLYLSQLGRTSVLLPALELVKTDQNGEPEQEYIRNQVIEALDQYPDSACFITQGYICRNANGDISNLQRGGSDYSATLFGAAIQAEEIQIWTDIDGIHNNDPRIIEDTFPIPVISYREAAELAYFGAKILHPTCVIPAETAGVPIRLKNTFDPQAAGTLVSNTTSGRNITAVAAKSGITAIRIRSGRMLNAYGFLRKVFEVFEQFRTPIDMITTSEVSVSLTIDDNTYLDAIIGNLEPYGNIQFETGKSIICIVGDNLDRQGGQAQLIFDALGNIPINMVSYGGSRNNLSLLVGEEHKGEALRRLDAELFRSVRV